MPWALREVLLIAEAMLNPMRHARFSNVSKAQDEGNSSAGAHHGRTGVGSPLPSARKDVTLVGYFRDFCNGDISLVARLQPTCYTYDPRCTMPCYTYDSFQSYSIICRLPCPLQRLALPIGCLLKVTRLGPKGHHRFRICIPQSLAHVVAYIGNI